MTPVRAIFAGFLAAILFGAGLFVAAKLADAKPQDLGPLLALSRNPFELLCFLAAWGALFIGALGVLTAFIGFLIPDDEEPDLHGRRRGFPKAAPILLILIALALAWFAFRCANAPIDHPPIAAPIEPATDVVDTPPIDGEPPAALTTVEPAPVEPPLPDIPEPVATATTYSWTFKYPLPRYGAPLWSAAAEPFDDSVETRNLLCGKAWIAVTGSASQEGPSGRNLERARLRTVKAVTRARSWLSDHPECGAPPVFGVNLGQHVAIGDEDDDGSQTGYQRQVLVIARQTRDEAEPLSRAAAQSEIEILLADQPVMARMLGGRRFTGPPDLIYP